MNKPDIINETTILKPDFALATNRRAEYGSTIPIADTISPKDLLGSILRNKRLITVIVLTFVLFTLLLLLIIPPRYTADALLMIENRDGNTVGVTSFIADQSISNETIESEIEVIKSRTLAGKVIKLLHLENNPDFNTNLEADESAPEPVNLNSYLPDFVQLSSGQNSDRNASTDNASTDKAEQTADILKHYYDGLSVTRKGISRVINIQYTTQNPVTATNIVNTISNQYILQQREMKYKEAGKVTDWLNERIKPLQKKVEESETAVENFRKNSGLLESKGITLTSQQMTELNNHLIQAEQKYDETSARLRQINKLINSPQGAGTFSAVRQSPLIQHLRVKGAKLQQKLSELSTEYGPRHPTMIQLRAEINDLHENINQEILNISSSLKNEAALARSQKFYAQKRLDELKEEVAQSNNSNVELRALEREAEANRTLLETFLSRLKKASTQKGMDVQQPNARILSRAITPVIPSFPKKVPILALAFIGSAILAMLFVLIRESMDRGLYTVGLVKEHTGLPSLGYIPTIRKRNGLSPESYQAKLPQSSFSGAIRALYTSILLSSPEKQPKSILVTSAQQKEGKSTIANTLAISRALAGQKTIIIDTDLRMANVNKAFNVSPTPGLVELLNGDVEIEEVIHSDAKTGTDIIPAGSLIQNPVDLLMSENLDRLLKVLNETYDLIVLDSPPILDATDARILMSKVDVTIFVAKWKHTKRQLIREALRNIAVPGNNIAGVLLNMVDEKKQASYGYGGANYAYGQPRQNQG